MLEKGGGGGEEWEGVEGRGRTTALSQRDEIVGKLLSGVGRVGQKKGTKLGRHMRVLSYIHGGGGTFEQRGENSNKEGRRAWKRWGRSESQKVEVSPQGSIKKLRREKKSQVGFKCPAHLGSKKRMGDYSLGGTGVSEERLTVKGGEKE